MKLLALCVLLLSLAACEQRGTGVQGATGETPVKYVICSAGERDCFVAARFKSLDACESHKNWGDMRCDSLSKPGEMHCRKGSGPVIAVTYCTL